MKIRRKENLVKRILRMKQELLDLGEMRPGTLSKQFNVCGTAGCRCKDSNDPQKHGPYYQLSYTRHGKSKSEYVKEDRLSAVRKQSKNYQRFVKLTEAWMDLSMEPACLRKSEREQPRLPIEYQLQSGLRTKPGHMRDGFHTLYISPKLIPCPTNGIYNRFIIFIHTIRKIVRP